MRHAANFNPEWGYFAPVPSFVRTARLVIVTAAIGATAGAAVVFSLVDRPLAEQSVAARTLVHGHTVSAPAAAGMPVAAQLTTELQHPQPLADAPVVVRSQGAMAPPAEVGPVRSAASDFGVSVEPPALDGACGSG